MQLNTNQIELSLVYLGYFSVILVMSIYKNLQPVQLNRYDRYKHPSLTKENETGDLDPRVIKPTVSPHCVFWMCICDHMIGMRVGRVETLCWCNEQSDICYKANGTYGHTYSMA